jgi:hypothetical protein
MPTNHERTVGGKFNMSFNPVPSTSFSFAELCVSPCVECLIAALLIGHVGASPLRRDERFRQAA